MEEIEYFHVFESIIYAGIITNLLIGWGRMVIEWGDYKFSWVHFLFTLDIMLFYLQRYASFSDMEHYKDIKGTPDFIFKLFLPVAVGFLSSMVVTPKSLKDVDLAQHVRKFSLPIVFPMLLNVCYMIFVNLVLYRSEQIDNFIPHLVIIGLFLAFIITKDLRIGGVVAVAVFAVMAYFSYLY